MLNQPLASLAPSGEGTWGLSGERRADAGQDGEGHRAERPEPAFALPAPALLLGTRLAKVWTVKSPGLLGLRLTDKCSHSEVRDSL